MSSKDPIINETSSPTRPEDFLEISEADDIGHVILAEQLERISLNPTTAKRFLGQASPIMAAQQASALRSQLAGVPDGGWDLKHFRRPLFWIMSPWELEYVTSPETTYVFPDFDLLLSLVTIYFEKINTLLPILHEPTFMEALMSWKHYQDQSFGMTVLLVCANASRYSTDPRVCYSPDHQKPAMSAGWHYFSQIPIHRKIMLYTATVYDLQYYSLAAIYLSGTSLCPVSCNLVGIGLRYAIELGAHRRKGKTQPSADAELLKRAFWFANCSLHNRALFCLDSIVNSFHGRPSGISHESFDIEYPIECDDEYWEDEDPEKAFKQPPGKPCVISNFVYLIKLCEILGFASRTLYCTKKSRILSGYFGDDWDMRMVAELDSSLNKWKASLPPYCELYIILSPNDADLSVVLWDPDRENSVFFQQTANLHATFFYVQILVHRPFLTKQSSLSFSSLAMCTNAARSCSHIQEVAMARDRVVLPITVYNAFTAGIIIVLCLWGSQRPGYVGDLKKEKDNLLKCVKILGECESIWHSAGAFRDILCEAGAISQYDDPALQTQSFTMGNASQTNSSAHDIFEHHFLSPPTDDTSSNTNWDLYRLLLTEMGHREVRPATEITSANIQVAAPNAAQLPEPANVNDAFTFWTDASTAFNW
ncbi:hypothetical protein CVT25_011943 [Psilocybe cyanescens]|uniref:Xylanolytic transcriptional activator regulatory domain-containing protein n=1 Tax=Psilocybe cyanescens TaxID=93625 RepID=A0A409XQS2_PSICY|nr:hypothetical protein CVT25_011943 [Psilocybe cyanescens]